MKKRGGLLMHVNGTLWIACGLLQRIADGAASGMSVTSSAAGLVLILSGTFFFIVSEE